MPDIQFWETVPAPGGHAPARGSYDFRPTRSRFITVPDGVDEEVLPSRFRQELDATGRMTVGLDVTGVGWCWRIDRHVAGVPGETVFVVVAETDTEWADLVRVDPNTLEPSADPEPAWWAMARSTVDGGAVDPVTKHLFLHRVDGVNIDAGRVGGEDGHPGLSNVLSIGAVTEGPMAVTIEGESPRQVLNFVIRPGADGEPGPPNTLAVGTVTKIPAGGTPTVTITGAAPDQVLNFGLVTGDAAIAQDTGWRKVTAASGGGWSSYTLLLRRVNTNVEIYFVGVLSAAIPAGGGSFACPSGFSASISKAASSVAMAALSGGGQLTSAFAQHNGSTVAVYPMTNSTNNATNAQVILSMTYMTLDAWPGTLPGVPA